MAETERQRAKHGQLDENAGQMLDLMLETIRESGLDMDAGRLMSSAIRLYAAAMYGKLTIVEREPPPGTVPGSDALH